MRKFQKVAAVALSSAMVVSGVAACSSSDGKETTKAQEGTEAQKPTEGSSQGDTTPEVTTTEAPKRDLGGMSIVIGDWWTNPDAAVEENDYNQATQDYRDQIQKDNNFTIVRKSIGGWGAGEGGIVTVANDSIMSGTPAAQVITLDAGWVPQFLNAGYMYSLDTLPSANFSDAKWNKATLAALTFNGHTYGMAVGSEPRLGVFFNVRLIEEAGYTADQLYDLQKNGEWTWETFEKVLAACTRDTNNDGVNDAYGMACQFDEFIKGAIYSNGAKYIDKDENGYFVNAMGTQEFLDAMNWGSEIWAKYTMPTPVKENDDDPDIPWDWFKNAFKDGKVAFRVENEYIANETKEDGTGQMDLSDDWGFLTFPKSSKDAKFEQYDHENVNFIPYSYSAEDADKIFYAFDLYTNTTPGYDAEDDWKRDYYPKFKHTRAVDETLQMIRDNTVGSYLQPFVTGLDLGPDFIWNIGGGALPQECLEARMPAFDQIVAEANEMIDKLSSK